MRPSWESARHLLSTYEGSASELFVIDLPEQLWTRIVSRLSELPDLEILVFAGEDVAEGTLFDSTWLERMQSSHRGGFQHSLRSANGTAQHLQIYIWTANASNPVIDIEFVFWNDMTFSSRVAESERARRLDALIQLAEDCRAGASEAQCILCDEHNGDPRELLDDRSTLVW